MVSSHINLFPLTPLSSQLFRLQISCRFFKNKRIVMFDTLINQVELPELLAILGHEIGHWQLSHALQGFVVMQV